MHASLAELLENMKSGLLWVQRDGVVRYANGHAAARTGLVPGRKLHDPDLSRAVAAAVTSQAPRVVNAVGVADDQPPGASAEVNCRVLPGLARDDAFVLIGNDGADDSAYDNLMQVIRSDLREPLRATAKALEVAGEKIGSYEVDILVDTIADLTRVLDKLVDMAELWGSGAPFASDRIELWPLLQNVWAELEPMAIGRSIKVRFRAQAEASNLAPLYGSEHWLRRVFLECLESAVRSSRPGAALEIEHRQMGPRALIVFRDCGVFAPRRTDAIELPQAAGKARPAAPRRDARDQIGLKLCQHIVSLHGGALREEYEDGARHFLIDLPTGAPHRNDSTELGIAQAQQYAKDLAALMARARTRRQTT